MSAELYALLGLVVTNVTAIILGWLKLRQVQHETQPNSGSTLRDAVNRIEAEQRRQGAELTAVRGSVGKVHTRVDTLYELLGRRR